MKVKELIELLQDMNPEAEVRMAVQRRYPHEYRIYGVASSADLDDALEDSDDEGEGPAQEIVYIAEGEWMGYARRAIWNVA